MRATAADIRYPRGLAPQASPLRTPVFRVLSRNDPIIPYEQCVAFAAQPTVGCANPPFATPSPTALPNRPRHRPVLLQVSDACAFVHRCVDEALFAQLDRVLVQPAAGHCAAFGCDPTLAAAVRDWREQKRIK